MDTEKEYSLTLKFKSIPKLIFVTETGYPDEYELYVNGEKVTGIKELIIRAEIGCLVTHSIDYFTSSCTEGDRLPCHEVK